MAKPVLGKSVFSDWFFLGQDRTVFMKAVYFCFGKKAGKLKICNQNSEKKKLRNCHSSQRNYQKKLKRLKFYRNFERSFSKRVLLCWRSGNVWCRNWNRHYRKPGSHRRFYQPTEKCKHKQDTLLRYMKANDEKWENWKLTCVRA